MFLNGTLYNNGRHKFLGTPKNKFQYTVFGSLFRMVEIIQDFIEYNFLF